MKINVRSPFKIEDNRTGLQYTQLELKVYRGTQDNNITPATYLLQSSAINNIAEFEISELIRDFIDNDFDGSYDTGNVYWFNYRLTSVTTSGTIVGNIIQGRAFYGYEYYNETIDDKRAVLQSNDKIFVPSDNGFHLAIDTENTNRVTFVDNEGNEVSESITTSNNSTGQIKYISNVSNGLDNFEQSVLDDGGIFENSICLRRFFSSIEAKGVNTIYVETNEGVEVLNVIQVEECKYTPLKFTFVNKYGAYQDLWFFKVMKENIITTKDEYKSNTGRQYNILNKMGNESFNINSGYYPESFNEIFKQMLLSESVWVEVNNQTLPVNIESSSLSFKKHVNDKLINYNINFKYAFDTIKNQR